MLYIYMLYMEERKYKTRILAFAHSFSEFVGGQVGIVVYSPFYNVVFDLINMLFSIFLCLTSILVSTANAGKTRSSGYVSPRYKYIFNCLLFNFIVSPCIFRSRRVAPLEHFYCMFLYR